VSEEQQMTYVVALSDPAAIDEAHTGGKASSLARLLTAGFAVPDGFCITTVAYQAAAAPLADQIGAVARQLHGADADAVERITAELRRSVESSAMPADVRDAIATAYAGLGWDAAVAVRSSGTAEDLPGASFAGLHDTFLDLRGTDAVLDAVRRCWASMWSARATAYRHQQGFEQSAARIAVVVQRMLTPRVSGVLFTANPLTAATDELVVNASWGLGESVVSGAVTPDQFVIRATDGLVLEREIGSKQARIDRDPDGGQGTVTRETTPAEREAPCLSDAELAQLQKIGVRLQDAHGGLAQDVEWAIDDVGVHVLQSRPITGVEFSWDADLERWQTVPDDPGTIWTRAMSDEGWTGAKTPLMYSWRANSWTRSIAFAAQLWGVPEMSQIRCWKFHRGEAYYSCAMERLTVEKTFPGVLRAPVLARIPAEWQAEVQASTPSIVDVAKVYTRMQLLSRQLGPLSWFRRIEQDYVENGAEHGRAGPSITDGQLRAFADAELLAHLASVTEHERVYCDEIFVPFFLYARDALSALPVLVLRWFGTDEPTVIIDLLTGTSKPTITQKENHALWLLAERIRRSPELQRRFDRLSPAEFVDGLDNSEDGREFRAAYEDFLSWSGHRGHSDRDLIFPRRAEDFSLDAAAFRALLTVEEPEDPAVREERIRAVRVETVERVLERVRRTPLGAVKAEVLRFVIDYADRFLMVRDNERHFVDRITFATRRAYLEIGRRLADRRLIGERDEVFFLGAEEVEELFTAGCATPLTALKIAARRRDFERVDRKEVTPPPYIVRGRGIDLDGGEDGGLYGVGTSRGTATGTARVIRELKDIGLLRHGDVLVCNSTDPGWTPVFSVISGVVLETGGMLAHASCLAREYGLPAVQLPGAMNRIPDGAQIAVDGGAGTVTVLEAVAA
jgi:rifampicin phosphotransferase